MTTGTVVRAQPGTRLSHAERADTDKRIDLNVRYLNAGFTKPELLEAIPPGVSFFLLPDYDPAFVEREVAFAATIALRGDDVYLRHVRVADLPDLPPTSLGPRPGQRRVSYGPDRSITANLVFGEDGAWHETDEPPPGPRDDPPW